MDEVLPPRFLVEAVPHLEPESLGLAVVQQTGALLGHAVFQAASGAQRVSSSWLHCWLAGPVVAWAQWSCSRLGDGLSAAESWGVQQPCCCAAGRLCAMKSTATHTPVHMYVLPSLLLRHAAEREARRGAL